MITPAHILEPCDHQFTCDHDLIACDVCVDSGWPLECTDCGKWVGVIWS